jgi:hypothetical protein
MAVMRNSTRTPSFRDASSVGGSRPEAQARNPYSAQGLWIPGSRKSAPRNDERCAHRIRCRRAMLRSKCIIGRSRKARETPIRHDGRRSPMRRCRLSADDRGPQPRQPIEPLFERQRRRGARERGHAVEQFAEGTDGGTLRGIARPALFSDRSIGFLPLPPRIVASRWAVADFLARATLWKPAAKAGIQAQTRSKKGLS